MNPKGITQAISQSLKVEGHNLALWAGFFTYFPQLFVYAYLTVGITNSFT